MSAQSIAEQVEWYEDETNELGLIVEAVRVKVAERSWAGSDADKRSMERVLSLLSEAQDLIASVRSV